MRGIRPGTGACGDKAHSLECATCRQLVGPPYSTGGLPLPTALIPPTTLKAILPGTEDSRRMFSGTDMVRSKALIVSPNGEGSFAGHYVFPQKEYQISAQLFHKGAL